MIKNLTDASVFPRKKSCAMIPHVHCMYAAAYELTNNIILLQAHDFE